jgi:hypothetical protein
VADGDGGPRDGGRIVGVRAVLLIVWGIGRLGDCIIAPSCSFNVGEGDKAPLPAPLLPALYVARPFGDGGTTMALSDEKDCLGGLASFVLCKGLAVVVLVAAVTATRCGWFDECAGRCIGVLVLLTGLLNEIYVVAHSSGPKSRKSIGRVECLEMTV